MRVELKGRGRAWEQGYRWDATKVLQRANRTMELVMKKSLSIGMKPESKRFNCDNGFELPDCWICLLYTSPSPRDATLSRMPSSA